MNDTSKIVSGNFLNIDRESFLRNYYGSTPSRNDQPTINPIGLSSEGIDRMNEFVMKYFNDFLFIYNPDKWIHKRLHSFLIPVIHCRENKWEMK